MDHDGTRPLTVMEDEGVGERQHLPCSRGTRGATSMYAEERLAEEDEREPSEDETVER